MKSSAFILFALLALLQAAPLHADIFECDGIYSSVPCAERGTMKTTFSNAAERDTSTKEAQESDPDYQKKQSLFHDLSIKISDAYYSHDIRVDISGVENRCLKEHSTVLECQELIQKTEDRLSSVVKEKEQIALKERELELKEEENRLQEEQNRIAAKELARKQVNNSTQIIVIGDDNSVLSPNPRPWQSPRPNPYQHPWEKPYNWQGHDGEGRGGNYPRPKPQPVTPQPKPPSKPTTGVAIVGGLRN